MPPSPASRPSWRKRQDNAIILDSESDDPTPPTQPNRTRAPKRCRSATISADPGHSSPDEKDDDFIAARRRRNSKRTRGVAVEKQLIRLDDEHGNDDGDGDRGVRHVLGGSSVDNDEVVELIDDDFDGDENGGDMVQRKLTGNRRESGSSSSLVERGDAEVEPVLRVSDLVINKAKIAEVRAWMTNRAGGLLVLVGPSGCGKTTLIRSLSQELGYSLVEMNNADDSVSFLRRCTSGGSLSFRAGSDERPLGQKGTVLLLDSFDRVSKFSSDFDALRRTYPWSLPNCRVVCCLHPDDHVHFAPGSSTSSALAEGSSMPVTVITLNALAKTFLMKALKEHVKKHRRRIHERWLTWLSDNTHGDLRCAKNQLDVFARIEKLGGSSLNLPETHQRDQWLDIFHATGKILHDKDISLEGLLRLPEALVLSDAQRQSPEAILLNWLRSNYTVFRSDIADLAQVADRLSVADTFLEQSFKQPFLSTVGYLVGVLGYRTADASRVSVGFYQVRPPRYVPMKYLRSSTALRNQAAFYAALEQRQQLEVCRGASAEVGFNEYLVSEEIEDVSDTDVAPFGLSRAAPSPYLVGRPQQRFLADIPDMDLEEFIEEADAFDMASTGRRSL